MINIEAISMATASDWDLIYDKVNIGSGNGLVPSGIRPLPKPMLTKITDTIPTLGDNGLKYSIYSHSVARTTIHKFTS